MQPCCVKKEKLVDRKNKSKPNKHITNKKTNVTKVKIKRRERVRRQIWKNFMRGRTSILASIRWCESKRKVFGKQRNDREVWG